jgi:hypothetical protein
MTIFNRGVDALIKKANCEDDRYGTFIAPGCWSFMHETR